VADPGTHGEDSKTDDRRDTETADSDAETADSDPEADDSTDRATDDPFDWGPADDR
jgi:hypothetical protein